MENKLKEFLQLKDFDEYMEKFHMFCGLEMGAATFRKEMELMERDAVRTHREKENIRDRKKRAAIKELHEKIETLLEEIKTEGVWRLPIDSSENVEVRYLFPGGRSGEINNYLAGLDHEPKKVGDNVFSIFCTGSEYELIELVVFPENNLFSRKAQEWDSPGMAFLLRYNRIAQIESLMKQVNYYKLEYRSMRTIPSLELKKLLTEHHSRLREKRDEVYEYLIEAGETNPRWKSEQKAYAIVKEHYPDAKFQYQPDFLFGQRLDIYIPSKKTAIEYQGRQHYEPVNFFGGSAGYLSNLKRDARKKSRCRANGIKILYWDYDKPVTDEYFVQEIDPGMEQGTVPWSKR